MTIEVLTRRALNRATLERQMLLRRSDLPVLDAVAHLVGLQAQIPQNPYLGLFSRLEGFRPQALEALLLDRSVVRIVVMRGTIHLVRAVDAIELRPLMQPVLDQELARHPEHAPALRGVNLRPALAFARAELAKTPMSGKQLRVAMANRFPKRDAAALAFACRCLLPLVQVPPRGLWSRSGEVRSTTLEAWVGMPLAGAPSIDEVVVRYLAAFGPATAADVTSWSRLTGMREVLDRLGKRLRTFEDENGRMLWDVPDAPRPDPDMPAPTRFLPEYDNVLLSHADRSRFFPETITNHSIGLGRAINGTVLHDGLVCATWRLERTPDRVLMHVEPVGKVGRRGAGGGAPRPPGGGGGGARGGRAPGPPGVAVPRAGHRRARGSRAFVRGLNANGHVRSGLDRNERRA